MSLGVEWGTPFTLIGPDGTTVVFNNSADPNFVGFLSIESSGLDSPEVREDAQDSTEADGGVHGNFFYGRRPVILQGTIIANSAAQRNERVGKLLRASNAMRSDATLKWKPLGASAEVEIKLRRQQPARITKGYVKDFFLPMVSEKAEIESTVLKASPSNFEERAETGPKTVVNATGIGTVAWTNPNNAASSNNVRASAALAKSGVSNYLKTSGHKFTLPANSFVHYFKAIVEGKKATSAGSIFPSTISFVKAGSIVGPTSGAGALIGFVSDSSVEHAFALPGFTKSDVENANFGVAVSISESGVEASTAEVDNIEIRVGTTFPVTVENAGDADAEWTAVLVNPTAAILTAPIELVNQTTGQALVLDTVPSSGEFITIDSKTHTITSNTRGNLYWYLKSDSSEWFKIVPGTNTLKCDKAQFEITFRDTWV